MKNKLRILLSLLVMAGSSVFSDTLLLDDLSGVAGESLVGSSLEMGGVWSNEKTDGSGSASGDFVFAEEGGVESKKATVFTAFPLAEVGGALSNGFTASITFKATGDEPMVVTFGLAEVIEQDQFSQLSRGDVVRTSYPFGGTENGRVRCDAYEEGVFLKNDTAALSTTNRAVAGDEVRLTLTGYPNYGIFIAEAFNLTDNAQISRAPLFVNSMSLTNLCHIGFGVSGDPLSPVRISSFSASTKMIPPPRPFSLSTDHPPSMTGFAFHDQNQGVSSPDFHTVLAGHEQIDIIHEVRDNCQEAVRAAYPDKIMVDQKAWGGSMNVPLETIWPGHCLLKLGTVVTSDCPATMSDTVLHLEDYSIIAKNQNKIDDPASTAAGYAVLFALDENGKADWSRSEHVKPLAVDTNAGTLTVERGVLNSTPHSYEAGRVAIARHMMFWTSQWQLNFSLHGPRGGPFNMTAAEWYAFQMAQRILANDEDGVEFDVARWLWGYHSSNRMDCDGDMVADYGYIDGVCSFGLGGQVFLRELRERLGPERIIQMDGSAGIAGQRGWKYVNGVQIESFPSGNKFYRFSHAFQHLQGWINRVENENPFSYPFTKTPTTYFGNGYDTDGSTVDWRFRIGFASALLTGMPHPFASLTDINFDPENPEMNEVNEVQDKGFYVWDEYIGGELGDYQWLGAPLGEMIQVDDQVGTSNLLESVTWDWVVEDGFIGETNFSDGEYHATITEIPSDEMPWVSEYYTNSSIPKAFWYGIRIDAVGMPEIELGKEYTIEFEARGNDDWTVDGEVFESVPRALAIHGIAEAGYNNPLTVLLGDEWRTYRFNLIATNSTPLSFGFSEQVGDASIRNIRLYEGCPDRYVREFERGRVYLNMTKQPWRVSLESGEVQRLKGTQLPRLNNGRVVDDWLIVPAWDAVFLQTDTYDAWSISQFGVTMTASDSFETGFEERELGDSIIGVPVEKGDGIWSNERPDGNTLNGSMVFTNGGLTEVGSKGGGCYLPVSALEDDFKMEVVVTPNDFAGGTFTIGFAEVIDNKGFLVNFKQGDLIQLRYKASASAAGDITIGIYNDGEKASPFPESTLIGAAPDASDTVKLILAYNASNGLIQATAYNVTDEYEISNASTNVLGLANMVHATLGWSGLSQDEALAENYGVISDFKVGETSMFSTNQVSDDIHHDSDGDGFSNFEEYVAGTDPQDPYSFLWVEGAVRDGLMTLRLPAKLNRVSDVYVSTNLMDGFVLQEEGIEFPQTEYTNQVPTDSRQEFYKIKMRRPTQW